MSFLSTYSALRLTGHKGPQVAGPLLKAAALIVYATIMLPVAGLRLLAGIHIHQQPPTPPPTPQGAERGAFAASVDQLQEDMK
jgi:hypothetical protein